MRQEADPLTAREELARRLTSDTELENAVRAAVQAAVREHKRAGNPVAGWQDGRVVLVAPEDIPTWEDVPTEQFAAPDQGSG